MAGAIGGRTLERLPEQRQLAVTAHHRRIQPPGMTGGPGRDVIEPVRRDRLGLAFGGDRVGGLGTDGVARQPVRLLADQDLSRGGCLFQAGRGVHGVTRHERLPGRGIAGDDLARVHADPRGERDPVVALELLVEVDESVAHLHRRPDPPERVVLMHLRDPEDRHHRVPDELLHRAAVAFDRDLHRVEVARHHATERLRVEQLAERRRAGDVAEHDGDGLADLVAPRLLGKRRRARHAEARLVGVLDAAAGTDAHRPSLVSPLAQPR